MVFWPDLTCLICLVAHDVCHHLTVITEMDEDEESPITVAGIASVAALFLQTASGLQIQSLSSFVVAVLMMSEGRLDRGMYSLLETISLKQPDIVHPSVPRIIKHSHSVVSHSSIGVMVSSILFNVAAVSVKVAAEMIKIMHSVLQAEVERERNVSLTIKLIREAGNRFGIDLKVDISGLKERYAERSRAALKIQTNFKAHRVRRMFLESLREMRAQGQIGQSCTVPLKLKDSATTIAESSEPKSLAVAERARLERLVVELASAKAASLSLKKMHEDVLNSERAEHELRLNRAQESVKQLQNQQAAANCDQKQRNADLEAQLQKQASTIREQARQAESAEKAFEIERNELVLHITALQHLQNQQAAATCSQQQQNTALEAQLQRDTLALAKNLQAQVEMLSDEQNHLVSCLSIVPDD